MSRRRCPPANFLSLPNELLFIILGDIDQLHLLDLALCCRRLHFCAVQTYLARHGLPDPTSLGSVTLSSDSKVLPALTISLFFTSVGSLRWKFSRYDFHTEARQLAYLLSRFASIDELILDFTKVDYWALSFTVKDEARFFLSAWIRNFESLIDAALAKDCLGLTVCRGRVYPAASQSHGIAGFNDSLYWRDKLPPNSFISSLLNTGGDPYREALGLPHLSVCKNAKSRSTLSRFHVHSSMLLHPTHSFWTLHLLNTSPITNLSLMNIDFPASTWDKLLPCITLPSLSTLSFACCTISSPTLTKFLSRHRRVTTLTLGERLPSADDIPPSKRSIAFDHITTLTAPIDYILQLLTPSTPPPLPNLRLLSVQVTIPTLRNLSIHTGIFTGRPHHSFHTLSNLIQSSTSRGTLLSMTLVLQTETDTWLDALVDDAYIGAGHVLRDILHLVVSANPKILSPRMVAQFPVWLASFPRLQRVAFVASPEAWEMCRQAQALIRSIREKCASVQSVVLSGVEHGVVAI